MVSHVEYNSELVYLRVAQFARGCSMRRSEELPARRHADRYGGRAFGLRFNKRFPQSPSTCVWIMANTLAQRTCYSWCQRYSDEFGREPNPGGSSRKVAARSCSAASSKSAGDVIDSKSGCSASRDLDAGGNGARHVRAALEGSHRAPHRRYRPLLDPCLGRRNSAEALFSGDRDFLGSGRQNPLPGIFNRKRSYVSRLVKMAAGRGLPGPISLQYQ